MKSILIALLLVLSFGCATPAWSGMSREAYSDEGASDGLVAAPATRMAYSKAVDSGAVDSEEPGFGAEASAPVDQVERQVIYSASLQLVVVSVLDASNGVLAIAKQSGGYLQSSDANSITVRVPAAKFEAALDQMAKLGEVVDRSVNASDVTEEMLDLGIRLDNAKRARERLLEHLAKSDKIEDTLKIEMELSRVTLEIEQIEGRLRYLSSQIAMSTIRVGLNSRSPQGGANDGLAVPFAWISRLGDGLIAGAVESLPRKPGWFSSGPKFDPPSEFLRYYSSDDLVEAMDAGGLRIKVQRQKNYDEGALAFWSKLARKSLVETRSLAVGEERDIDNDRTLLVGSRDVGGETYGYLLLITRTEKRLHTFEAWGPLKPFQAQRAALEESALSLKR